MMDAALALVRWYLHANGYFTITEYPVIEAVSEHDVRSVTDIDVMAIRLPNAGATMPQRGRGQEHDLRPIEPDATLVTSEDRIDMIIGEVKEGQIELNQGARDPAVLRAVLSRFGAIDPEESARLVRDLLERGEAAAEEGPRIRLMAFGAYRGKRTRNNYTTVTLGHILDFVEQIIDRHWPHLKALQFKDPAVNYLVMLHKARLSDRQRAGSGR